MITEIISRGTAWARPKKIGRTATKMTKAVNDKDGEWERHDGSGVSIARSFPTTTMAWRAPRVFALAFHWSKRPECGHKSCSSKIKAIAAAGIAKASLSFRLAGAAVRGTGILLGTLVEHSAFFARTKLTPGGLGIRTSRGTLKIKKAQLLQGLAKLTWGSDRNASNIATRHITSDWGKAVNAFVA